MGQTCQKCSEQENERKKEDIIYVKNDQNEERNNLNTEKFKNSERVISSNGLKKDQANGNVTQSTRHIGSDMKFSLTDKKDTIKLADGSVFEGEIVNGVPEGYGKQTMPNGDEYIGYFIKGKRNGVGKLYKKNGLLYHGNFQNNKISGFGVMKHTNGDEYSGMFKNGSYNGQGKLFRANGTVDEGIWVDGKLTKISQ